MVWIVYFTYDFTVSFRDAMDMREILERLTENNETLQRLERRFDAVVAFTPVPDATELKEKSKNVKKRVLMRVELRRGNTLARIHKMRDYLNEREGISFSDRRELLEQMEKLAGNLSSRSDRQYLRVVKHLRHNPGVVSAKYQKALEEIKNLFEK